MNTVYMTVKITEPQREYEFTAQGGTLAQCADEIREYLDSTPHGTRVYMVECSDEGESYEVTR
jgi:hypothetical protein